MSKRITHRGVRLVTSIWRQQKARFYCISTKTGGGKWKDHYFEKEDFGDIEEFLEDHEGEDIYWCIHGFKARSREIEDSVLAFWLWADLDESDPRDWEGPNKKLKPTILIESSPGRFAGFWRIDRTATTELNRRLTYQVGADKGCWNAGRVLRFPGTRNYKYKAHPEVRILWSDGDEYEYAEIDRLVADLDKEDDETGQTARDLLKKYGKKMRHTMRSSFVKPAPAGTDRSSVIWKMIKECIEIGMTEEETHILMASTPICRSKYEGRNITKALNEQIEKAVRENLTPAKTEKTKKPKPPTDDDEDEGERRRFGQRTIGDVEEKQPDWLLFPYLARGELTIIEGMEDSGKSWITMYIAACVADGRKFPQPYPSGLALKRAHGKVVYCDYENSASSISKARFIENGLENQDNLLIEEEPFSVMDEDLMEDFIEDMKEVKPELIVFDSMVNYLDAGTDSNHTNQANYAVRQFKKIARAVGCAVILIRHWVKGREGKDLRDLGQGNKQWNAQARVVLAVKEHPDDEEFPNHRVMWYVRNGWGLKPKGKALVYEIESRKNNRAGVVIHGWQNISELDIMKTPGKPGQKEKPSGAKEARESAELLLNAEFRETGKVAQSRIERLCEKRGIDFKDLKRAAKGLGVKIVGDAWVWKRPKD